MWNRQRFFRGPAGSPLNAWRQLDLDGQNEVKRVARLELKVARFGPGVMDGVCCWLQALKA